MGILPRGAQVHITALFHRVFQSSCLAMDLKGGHKDDGRFNAKTVDQLLSIQLTEEYTESLQQVIRRRTVTACNQRSLTSLLAGFVQLMLCFYPSSHGGYRGESVLQRHSHMNFREQRDAMVDQSLFPQNNALKVARNVISVLYLQLRFPIQAPHTIHNQTDHHTHSVSRRSSERLCPFPSAAAASAVLHSQLIHSA